MKKIRYLAEAAGLYLLYYFFAVLPPATASNIGGWLGRTIGPRTGATRTARKNLEAALPEISGEERETIIAAMWDNLGRVIAEYPHLEVISRERTEVAGTEVLERLFSEGSAAIFIGGHIANWEVNCAAMLTQFGRDIDLTYRAPNNPWADRLLARARTLKGKLRAHPKTRDSGRQIIAALKSGRYVGILIDQKYNEGMAVPFFGQEAMTNPVFAQLAQKYQCPLIPVQGERLGPARFRLTVHEPLALVTPDGKPRPTPDIMQDANDHLESWIRTNPASWLWLHKRWNSKANREKLERAA